MGHEIVQGLPSTHGDTYQLNTTTLIRHSARTYPEQQIVYRTTDGGWDRYTYADAYSRIMRSANALRSLGVGPADVVGILDWNSKRHFELYWAIPPGLAAVMLQMNLRLAPEDLGYVTDHSGASVVLVDESLLPVAEVLAPPITKVTTWVVMTDKPMSQIATNLPGAVHWEDLVDAAESRIEWPVIDEHSTYSACYTTGTTGRPPKGIYYSHRGIYLHTLSQAANLGMRSDDTAMLITPMFHGQSWGATPPVRSVQRGEDRAARPLRRRGHLGTGRCDDLRRGHRRQRRTSDLPAHARLHQDTRPGTRFPPHPPAVRCNRTRPIVDARLLRAHRRRRHPRLRRHRDHPPGGDHQRCCETMLRDTISDEQKWDLKRSQGLPVNGIDIRLVDSGGNDLPHDGISQGEVLLRGPWIIERYHKLDDDADRFLDGYWRSGDVGRIDTNGYLKLTDRLKDVIKSGGEWISSIDMENALVGHPKIKEAAVIGVSHPKWQERPVALVVTVDGEELDLTEITACLMASSPSGSYPTP